MMSFDICSICKTVSQYLAICSCSSFPWQQQISKYLMDLSCYFTIFCLYLCSKYMMECVVKFYLNLKLFDQVYKITRVFVSYWCCAVDKCCVGNCNFQSFWFQDKNSVNLHMFVVDEIVQHYQQNVESVNF